MACGLAAVPLQTPSKLAILHETLDRGAAAADLDHPPRETLFPPWPILRNIIAGNPEIGIGMGQEAAPFPRL